MAILRHLLSEEAFEDLLGKMKTLGETCLQILLDSEYWGYSSDEIAQRIGYRNVLEQHAQELLRRQSQQRQPDE